MMMADSMSTASPKNARRAFPSAVGTIRSTVISVFMGNAPCWMARSRNTESESAFASFRRVRAFSGTIRSPGLSLSFKAPASPDEITKSGFPSCRKEFLAKVTPHAALPIPVSKTSTSLSPNVVLNDETRCKDGPSSAGRFLNSRSLRQGANSASTANVTRMRIKSFQMPPSRATIQNKDTGLKTGHYKTLGGCASHALGAALGDVAVCFVPAHRALERRGYRPRLKSQFTLGARAIHKHHVARDLDAFDWYARLAPDQPRKSRTRIGYTQRESMRNFQNGRAETRYLRECVQHLLEREIFTAQEIALADLALFGDQQVSCRALFHANKIQAGLHVAGHLAIQKIQNDFSGRRRLPVPRPYRRRRHGHNDRQSTFRGVERLPFRHPLRALVVAHHFFQLGAGEFIRMLRPIDGDGCHGAGVNQLLHAGALSGVQKIFCSADVGIVYVLLALGPQAVIRGDVKDALDTFHRAIERGGVAQIPGHVLERQIRNRTIGARRAQKNTHSVAAGHQLPCHVAAEESRRACDQRAHATLMPSSSSFATCSRCTAEAPAAGRLRCSPRSTGSTSREKDSHQILPIRLRASAVFCDKVRAAGSAAFDSPRAGEITHPSTFREWARWNNSAASLISVSGVMRT